MASIFNIALHNTYALCEQQRFNTHALCEQQRLPYLEEALIKVDTSDPAAVNSVLDKFSQAVVSNEHSVFHR